MVTISQNPAAAAELIRRADEYQKTVAPRAEGLHVSDLIYCRRKSWYRLQNRAAGLPAEEYDTDTLAMFLLGHGYHALLEQGVDERRVILKLWHPDTGSIDVHGTVDHIEYAGTPYEFPHEFKTTRASSAKPIDSVQHYIEQVADYCLAMGVNSGQLSVIYINGAYNKGGSGMKPTIRTFDLVFTDDELRAWKVEQTRRARVLLAPTPPPLPEHRTWECNYCPFSYKRGGPCESGPGDARRWFVPDSPDFLVEVLEGI